MGQAVRRTRLHVHMTSTPITDPESREHRYPCIRREFSIGSDSGGAGLHRGGDGCVRDIDFGRGVDFSVRSERRTIAQYGGESGQCGQNIWVGMKRVVGAFGKNTCRMGKGG